MGVVYKRHERTFQGDDNILCTDRGFNYTGIATSQGIYIWDLCVLYMETVFERKKYLQANSDLY